MSEWLGYGGEEREGVCPVSGDTLVFVRFRNGIVEDEVSRRADGWRWAWNWGDRSYDIVAYALAKEEKEEEPAPVKTGGSTPNQYRISVNLPMTEDRTKFAQVDLEAMDVIDALDLSGNLKDVLKALFRLDRKAGVSVEYDLTKSIFYLLREMKKREFISHGRFWEISDYISKALKEE